MALIVLVNGIDDCGEAENVQRKRRIDLFSRHFPDAKVEVFDFFDENDGFIHDAYLRHRAEDVISHLQRSPGEPTASDESHKSIVFVAHNTGAALVQQVLLLASEDHRHQWIALGTVALYFIESPSYTDYHEWERFLFGLLATGRLPFSNLPTLVNVLPKALARIQVQFFAISHAFDIDLTNPNERAADETAPIVFEHTDDPWNFHGDESKLDHILLGIRAALRKSSPRLQPRFQEFQKLLSRPDALMSRLNADTFYLKLTDWVKSEESTAYRSWADDHGSSVLGITGRPGSGNTHLSSRILHMLLANNRDSGAVFLSFSFYRWDSRRNSERSLITSLIRQLLTLRPGFYKRLDFVVSSLSAKPAISCAQLWAMFRYLLTIPKHSRVFLVLNAVDQCIQSITDKIGQLATIPTMTIPLKIVMTSSMSLQMPPDISFHYMVIEATDLSRTIREIAWKRMSRIADKRPVWKDSKEVMVEKLCSGDYTYLYVMLSLDLLEHSKTLSTRDAVRQHLMAPVPSVESIFKDMLSNLDGAESAMEALNWIFHAVRPLSTSELAVALTLGTDTQIGGVAGPLTLDIITETVSWDIMRDLGDLLGIAVKAVDDRVFLVHHTFRDYLEGQTIIRPDFHASITRRCLLYLKLFSQETTPLLFEQSGRFERSNNSAAAALLDYAQLYWIEHYKQEPSPSPEMDAEVEQFLSSESDALESWIEKCTQVFAWEEGISHNPLVLATQLGLGRIVNNILQTSSPTDPSLIQDAIVVAGRIGDLSILNKLLEPAMPTSLVPVLRAAAEYGQTDVLELLLDRMSDSDVETLKSEADSEDLVHLAARKGHTAAVKHLLSSPRGIGTIIGPEETAVHLASLIGDVDTLLALKELRGDDFSLAMKTQNTARLVPLQLVCSAGYEDAFDLVKASSPYDLVHGLESYSRSPIQLAASHGHLTIVEKLILAGVNVSKSPEETPLALAATSGHYDVVCCLFSEFEKSSLDFEEKGWKELLSVSLMSAIREGHIKIVEFLLQKAKRDQESDRKYIQEAVDTGHLEVLKLLVSVGISVKMEDDSYNDILDMALRENSVDMVRYLINQGVKPQWDGDESSIHFAARLGFEFCIRELLREATDDDVWKKDGSSTTALEISATFGQLEAFKELLRWKNGRALSDNQRRPPNILLSAIRGTSDEHRPERQVEFVDYLLSEGWSADTSDSSQDFPLHVAVLDGNMTTVKLLLDRNANPDAGNKNRETPLYIAVRSNKHAIAGFLLENGADQNLVDADSLTPLHVAARESHDEVVRVLLGLDRESDDPPSALSMANVEKQTAQGWRCLHYAHTSSAITGMLLGLDPKPDFDAVTSDTKKTPLILAVSRGARDTAGLLLGAGADPNIRDSVGWTALHHAAAHHRQDEQLDIIRDLIDHHVDCNARGDNESTPLYVAIRNGHDQVASYLLEDAKVNPNIYGGVMHSPLQSAVDEGKAELVASLLKAGADANAQGGSFGSPLNAAAYHGHVEIAKLLLKHGAVPSNEAPPFGAPLHALTANPTEKDFPFREIASLLVEHGANVDARDYTGSTALMLMLLRRRDEDEKEALLSLKANPNAVADTGATALHYAVASYSPNLIQELLKAGANAEALDKGGRGVLYYATLNTVTIDLEGFEMALEALPSAVRTVHLAAAVPAALKAKSKLLFEAITTKEGVDLNVPDRSGWTALDVADCYDLVAERDMLQSKGATRGTEKLVPTGWCPYDKAGAVLVVGDRREARIEGFGNKDTPIYISSAVRADHCIPPDYQGIFYFEVEVLECGQHSIIGVGLVEEREELTILVGWKESSWGYHSSDGMVITANEALYTGPAFGADQTVGVAVDQTEKKAWFTLDGVMVGTAIPDVRGQLYPAVSFQQGPAPSASVRVNFGPGKGLGSPFKYKPEGGPRETAAVVEQGEGG